MSDFQFDAPDNKTVISKDEANDEFIEINNESDDQQVADNATQQISKEQSEYDAKVKSANELKDNNQAYKVRLDFGGQWGSTEVTIPPSTNDSQSGRAGDFDAYDDNTNGTLPPNVANNVNLEIAPTINDDGNFFDGLDNYSESDLDLIMDDKDIFGTVNKTNSIELSLDNNNINNNIELINLSEIDNTSTVDTVISKKNVNNDEMVDLKDEPTDNTVTKVAYNEDSIDPRQDQAEQLARANQSYEVEVDLGGAWGATKVDIPPSSIGSDYYNEVDADNYTNVSNTDVNKDHNQQSTMRPLHESKSVDDLANVSNASSEVNLGTMLQNAPQAGQKLGPLASEEARLKHNNIRNIKLGLQQTPPPPSEFPNDDKLIETKIKDMKKAGMEMTKKEEQDLWAKMRSMISNNDSNEPSPMNVSSSALDEASSHAAATINDDENVSIPSSTFNGSVAQQMYPQNSQELDAFGNDLGNGRQSLTDDNATVIINSKIAESEMFDVDAQTSQEHSIDNMLARENVDPRAANAAKLQQRKDAYKVKLDFGPAWGAMEVEIPPSSIDSNDNRYMHDSNEADREHIKPPNIGPATNLNSAQSNSDKYIGINQNDLNVQAQDAKTNSLRKTTESLRTDLSKKSIQQQGLNLEEL